MISENIVYSEVCQLSSVTNTLFLERNFPAFFCWLTFSTMWAPQKKIDLVPRQWCAGRNLRNLNYFMDKYHWRLIVYSSVCTDLLKHSETTKCFFLVLVPYKYYFTNHILYKNVHFCCTVWGQSDLYFMYFNFFLLYILNSSVTFNSCSSQIADNKKWNQGPAPFFSTDFVNFPGSVSTKCQLTAAQATGAKSS